MSDSEMLKKLEDLSRKSITIEHAVDILNTLVECDRDAIRDLIGQRVDCNKGMVEHPTCQVTTFEAKDCEGTDMTSYAVGLLGVLNAIFGTSKKRIAASYDDVTHEFSKFIVKEQDWG